MATVNKMDLIGFAQARFTEVEDQLRQMAARLGGADITVIPIAAKHGDNVVHRSGRTPWYGGPRCWNIWKASNWRHRKPKPHGCGCRCSGYRGPPPRSAAAIPAARSGHAQRRRPGSIAAGR
ncbi:cysN/CysC bifunctional enzyme domain protein [Mycobacterium xenopi 3993]|nr:cysN/CysC bifunctional enzyme domain protein [Mycobacterium xenopi 3993]